MSITTYLSRKWGKLTTSKKTFDNSSDYWKDRYSSGGNSGAGSYGKLAIFKAVFLNDFVAENKIKTIIEFGSGDGNQLTLAEYPSYIGFDISPKAISLCQKLFKDDSTKQFLELDKYKSHHAELSMSLDVIFHLVEDSIFHDYMTQLFSSSQKYVVIFSSNTNKNKENPDPHVRHRKFTDWIEVNQNNWVLLSHIKNQHPFNGNNKTGSFADFYIFKLVSSL
jgi:hypothetical protein